MLLNVHDPTKLNYGKDECTRTPKKLTDNNGICTRPKNSGAPRLSSSKTVISSTS